MGGFFSWPWQSNTRADMSALLPDGVVGLNEQTGKIYCNMTTKGKFRLTWRCDGAWWNDPAEAAKAAGALPRHLRQCDSCAGKQDAYERANAAAAAAAASAAAAATSASAASSAADSAIASDPHAR